MPSPSKSWTVVLFTEDQTVEAVPSRWIIGDTRGDTCLWPTVPRDKLMPLIRNCEFNSCWPSLPVRVFRCATYDNYGRARAKATKAEETSELNTDTDDIQQDLRVSKRKHKRKMFSSSESSDDEEVLVGKRNTNNRKKLPPPPAWQEDYSLNIEDNTENLTPSRASSSSSQQPQRQTDNASDVLSAHHETNMIDNDQINNNHCRCNPHLLHNIHSMLLDLNKKVDKILSNRVEPAATTVNILEKSKINYPMVKEEQLNKFEEFITSCPEHYSALVMYFASQGGGNVYEFIRRCIAPVLGDELCKLFSFTGKKGKKEFAKLKIAKAIIESAQKIGISSNKKEMEIKIGDWLRRAPARKSRSELKNCVN